MRTDPTITQERLDDLLDWLDSDREVAGLKYEEIRRSLIKIFAWRKFSDPEGMADEVINRVARQVYQLRGTYEGKPQIYFYGVARKLMYEYQKRSIAQVAIDDVDTENTSFVDDTDEDIEKVDFCLGKCLQTLESTERELALAYYKKDGQAKIDQRRSLAAHHGIDTNALRQRMFRIRGILEACIEDCLESI